MANEKNKSERCNYELPHSYPRAPLHSLIDSIFVILLPGLISPVCHQLAAAAAGCMMEFFHGDKSICFQNSSPLMQLNHNYIGNWLNSCPIQVEKLFPRCWKCTNLPKLFPNLDLGPLNKRRHQQSFHTQSCKWPSSHKMMCLPSINSQLNNMWGQHILPSNSGEEWFLLSKTLWVGKKNFFFFNFYDVIMNKMHLQRVHKGGWAHLSLLRFAHDLEFKS